MHVRATAFYFFFWDFIRRRENDMTGNIPGNGLGWVARIPEKGWGGRKAFSFLRWGCIKKGKRRPHAVLDNIQSRAPPNGAELSLLSPPPQANTNRFWIYFF